MKKRILVLGIALVLLVLVVGVVFAGNYKGVVWGKGWSEGSVVTDFWNSNDYGVTAGATNVDTNEYKRLRLGPDAKTRLAGEWTVTAVHSF